MKPTQSIAVVLILTLAVQLSGCSLIYCIRGDCTKAAPIIDTVSGVMFGGAGTALIVSGANSSGCNDPPCFGGIDSIAGIVLLIPAGIFLISSIVGWITYQLD